jgi:hypothetical protein
MLPEPDDLRKEIDRRNAIRAQSGLPLLQADAEIARCRSVADKANFERYFQEHRHRFAHLWSDQTHGFLSNMGRWSAVRRELRQAMAFERESQ